MSKPVDQELKNQVKELENKIKILEEENRQLKKTEKSLQEIATVFDLFMEYSPIYIFFKDEHIRSLKLSKNFEKLLGIPLQDMIGKTMDDLFPSDLVRHMTEVDKRILREGRPGTFREELNGRIYDTIKFPIVRNGKPSFLAGFTIDITDQIKTEETLKKSEEKYRQIVENSDDMIWEINSQGTIIFVNTTAERLFGYRPEDFRGKSPIDFVSQEESEKIISLLQQAITSQKPIRNIEVTIICKDGSKKITESSAVPYFDEKGDLLGYRGFHRDITERKQMVEALEEKTKELKRYFESSLDLLCIADTDGYFRQLNPEWEKILGYKLGDLEKNNFLDFIHPDDMEATLEVISQLRDNKEVLNFVNRCRCKDGSYRWIEWRSAKPQGSNLIYAVARDISERKQAEELLKESEQRYRSLVELFPDAVVVHSGGIIEYVNPSGAKLLGVQNQQELIGRVFLDFVHKDYHQIAKERIEKAQEDNKPLPIAELKYKKNDGTIVDIEVASTPIYFGKKAAFLTVFRDITDRKRAEDIVKAKESELVTFFRHVSDVIFILAVEPGPNYRFTNVNQNFFNTTGLTESQVIGKYVSEIIPEPSLKLVLEKYRQAIHEMRTVKWEEISEYPTGLKYGAVSATPIFDKNGNCINLIGTVYDLTESKKAEEEKRKLEEQLFQSQKMESIGRLAGGVAHDFNNILAGIMGYAELLQFKFNDKSTTEGQAIDIIINGVERAASLTKQLLGFARGGKYNPAPLLINEVIKECVKVSEKIFEKNIEVKYQFGENIHIIEADKNQIHQVLTNIIINARDAMPNGGELIFSTNNVFIDDEFSRDLPEFKKGNYIKISITDTGTGMPKEVRERIFEPFYTTKGVGKGTGLGLAMVYGIVKNHNGYIHVYSEPGTGTTFTIYLPISGREIVEERKEQNVVKGDATILLVDDEENIRKVTQKQLESLGYKVVVAADGNEALTILKKTDIKADLVLLDMIMPNMGGRETYREIKKLNPDLKVVLVSGFSQNGKAGEILKEGAAGFIQKPFKLYEITKLISEVLRKQRQE